MSQVGTEVSQLQTLYRGRNRIFAESFSLLALVDKLKQEGMESFVGNDPKTLWGMGNFLLQPRPLVHTIETPEVRIHSPEQAAALIVIENLLRRVWEKRNKANLRRGGDTYFWTLVGRLLATGWYAVPYGMMADKFFVDVYEPETIFPEFSEDEEEGLLRLARVWTMPWKSAFRFVKREGWDEKELGTFKEGTNVTFKQLWRLNINGQVEMGVDSSNNRMFKQIKVMPGLEKIPIIAGAVSGLPSSGMSSFFEQGGNDLSKLSVPRDTRAAMGSSIMSTNQSLFESFNRNVTFLMQLMRDTANPKTFEKTQGNKRIVKSADEWYARGAHFSMGLNEDLGIIQLPGIPVEIQQSLILMRNMIQRGGFSDATFGTAIEGMSSIMLAQTSESAQQNLMTYHMAVQFIVSDVSTAWLKELLKKPLRYRSITTEIEQIALEVLGDIFNISVDSTYAIRIPGDLAQRVNLAKLASPTWELSPETAYDFFFPEVADGKLELERVAQSKAKQDPVFTSAKVIDALRVAATEVEGTNAELAKLYRSIADIRMQQIVGPATPTGPAPVNGTGASTNLIPSNVQEAQGGTRGDRNGRA